ncbi:hypothetical protein [Thalassotalea sediminis]|uniref:hypothetical protein n=1 Tax=Thalassotalea sediminis TaxID=1759089 RepID=UPI0025748534|nr:hypothetical protein [Thalassotalea sediminis]
MAVTQVFRHYFGNLGKYSLAFFLSIIFSPSLTAQSAEQVIVADGTNETDIPMHQVSIPAKDGFNLNGQFYPGKSDAGGVLLLHDCHHDSDSYDSLLVELSSLGLNALAIDFRGYGQSITEEFSHTEIKRGTKDFATYQLEVARLTAFWPSDVLSAHQFLRSRIEDTAKVAVVSSGCSALQAIELAENMRISAFVMVTPELSYMQKESFKNLIDMPIYFMASVYHANTYTTSKELFDWNGDSRSIFKVFKGIKHGDSLLKSRGFTVKHVAMWLEDTLAK